MGYWILTKVYKALRRAYLELSLHFLHLIFINFWYFSNLEKTYRWKKIKTKHLVFSKWWLSWQTSYRLTVFTINMLSYSPPNASIFKTPCESHLPSKIIIGVFIYFKLIAIRMKKTPCSKLLKSQFERKWLCFSRIMFCFIDYIANNIKKIKVDSLFIALEKGKRGSKLLALMLLNLYDVRKNMQRQKPDDSNPLREKISHRNEFIAIRLFS